MSDSGIYRTLQLRRIRSARKEIGVFHENIFLTLEISSPFLKQASDTESSPTGPPFSVHDVVVMKHLEDGVVSFAIDEFPDMDEDAIEKFWIKMVEQRRFVHQA